MHHPWVMYCQAWHRHVCTALSVLQDGTMMWGFTVKCDEGGSMAMYTDDKLLRDSWVRTVQSAVRAKQTHEYIDQRWVLDTA